MSGWRGLHNPERHFPEQGEPTRAWCATCDGHCDEGLCDRDDPCHCCLATEVETLRAQVEQLGDARHVPGPYPWHCPACQELHRVLGGAS